LPSQLVTQSAGELLPHLFTFAENRCVFSVALSLRSPSLGVTQHPALWSSDFPQGENPAVARPALVVNIITQKNAKRNKKIINFSGWKKSLYFRIYQ